MQKKYRCKLAVFITIVAICFTTAPATATTTPQISSGFSHNVVLAIDGTVWTWGSNSYGQLCDSTRPSPDAKPRPIPGLKNIVYVAAGAYHTMAVESNGTVWSCGANTDGQLGRGFTSNYERKVGKVVDPDGTGYLDLDVNQTGLGPMAVAGGYNHSLAVSNDGRVWAWGSNYGKLGADEPLRTICGGTECTKPIQTINVTNAVAVSAGLYHSMALADSDADGSYEVWTWGSGNSYDQLGRPGLTGEENYIPGMVDDLDGTGLSLTGIVAIAAGWNHNLAIDSAGYLYGWGTNEDYQSLVSDSRPLRTWVHNLTQPYPRLILSQPPLPNRSGLTIYPAVLTGMVSVAASQYHSLAVSSGATLDTILAWGKNSQELYQFCGGTPYTCVNKVLSDLRGVLGLGHVTDKAFSPLSVYTTYYPDYPPAAPLWNEPAATPWSIVAVAAGRQHSLALRQDGTIFASGVNNQFQLADSSVEYLATPAAVGLTNMVCTSSGVNFNFDVFNPPVDCDFDGDGIPYESDTCPSVYNPVPADADGDGIDDACDVCPDDVDNDIDNDGICAGNSFVAPKTGKLDNCPATPNVDQADSDNDNVGNACDTCPNDAANDVDNDGICGDLDNCPATSNVDQADFDRDGAGDLCDSDDDNDGVLDAAPDNCQFVANTDQTNSDDDSYGDACDSDDDNDDLADISDNCPVSFGLSSNQTDTDGDGTGDVCDPDDDNDTVPDESDNCPLVANADQTDTDGDLIGNACDICPTDAANDVDGDGICGDVDNCPTTANTAQLDSDLDGLGNACDSCLLDATNDVDFDTICGAIDNCPTVANPDQADADNDGLGDLCDVCPNDPANDPDNDGICNSSDNCPNASNRDQADYENDGIGNACDSCPDDPNNDLDNDGFCAGNFYVNPPKTGSKDNCPSVYNISQTDSDNDRIGDACDTDNDNDSVLNDVDNCPLVANADQINSDDDALGDACDPDKDNDGVLNDADNCPISFGLSADQTDSNGDGVGDVCDPDMDGDGVYATDNCPLVANADQANSDGDAWGDACDSCPDDGLNDQDSDGVCAGTGYDTATKSGDNDNCPTIANSDQADADGDNVGDLCDICPDDASDDNDGDGLCAGSGYKAPKTGDSDNCPDDDNADQNDLDGDGIGDFCDPDKDNDGADNSVDYVNIYDANGNVVSTNDYSLDKNLCSDTDGDLCNDCTNQVDGYGPRSDYNPNNDGLDTDSDGKCDLSDQDDDNDGIPDGADNASTDPASCKDDDGDGCDDCAVTRNDGSGGDVNNDGRDIDGDGICYISDPDDDNDGVLDGPSGPDTDSTRPEVCKDDDNDGCDDCAVTRNDGSGGDVNNDGPDSDNDGICDAGDSCLGLDASGDSDNDGVCDNIDQCPGYPDSNDDDNDGVPNGCDICTGDDASGDSDNDGICNDQETDDDNDGVADTEDLDPIDPFVCADLDNDLCDDCAVTGANGSGGNVANDGPDFDGDGQCDASESDDDKDGVPDTTDSEPLNKFICSDADYDNCDDCSSGYYAPANDGVDSDADGICDKGDSYPDNPLLVDPGISSLVIPPASNIDENAAKPKINMVFPFGVTVDDNNAGSVWLVINNQPLKMDCGDEPDFADPSSEVSCTLPIKLGPAPAYNYHYEVWDSVDRSGTMLVSSLEIVGPTVRLLNGPNMLGLPNNLASSTKGFLNNLGSNKVYSWESTGLHSKDNNGYFLANDNSHIPKPGKGYFIIGESDNQSLPEALMNDPEISVITAPSIAITLQPGWNLISNPYPAPLLLSSLMIQRNSEDPLSWADASAIRWVSNGIYYFKGKDWESQYGWESAGGFPDATLTPWLGYWIYVKIDNGFNYSLIFPKPIVSGE